MTVMTITTIGFEPMVPLKLPLFMEVSWSPSRSPVWIELDGRSPLQAAHPNGSMPVPRNGRSSRRVAHLPERVGQNNTPTTGD